MSNRTKTGTAMSGIVNTRNVKPVKCVCKKCSHRRGQKPMFICDYYDIINPNKTKCARYFNKSNDYILTDRERQELEARYGKRFGVKRNG